jgi:hypothetical protein
LWWVKTNEHLEYIYIYIYFFVYNPNFFWLQDRNILFQECYSSLCILPWDGWGIRRALAWSRNEELCIIYQSLGKIEENFSSAIFLLTQENLGHCFHKLCGPWTVWWDLGISDSNGHETFTWGPVSSVQRGLTAEVQICVQSPGRARWGGVVYSLKVQLRDIYIDGVYYLKITVINDMSGDLTRKLDMASSFTATGMFKEKWSIYMIWFNFLVMAGTSLL